MQSFANAFRTLFAWMGIPQISLEPLGFEESPCLCRDPRCQKTKVRLSAEFHVVKNEDGSIAAEPIVQIAAPSALERSVISRART